ncbi:MAG: hypothetical protein AB7F89_22580 [Pirellulaceae bacterium]
MPTGIKDEAIRVIATLPDDATWDDVARAMDEHASIARGLADLREGRTLTHAEVRRRFNLPR